MMFPYDTFEYACSLSHIGIPRKILNFHVLEREIPSDKNKIDAMGVWPYSSFPLKYDAKALYCELKENKYISFASVFLDDTKHNFNTFREDGFIIKPFKDHFVFKKSEGKIELSAKSKYNIRKGFRHWDVFEIEIMDYEQEISAMHEKLAVEKGFSQIAHLGPDHFLKLGKIPGFKALAAFDSEGIGAVLIVAQDNDDIHFHVIAGTNRAYKFCGFYALYSRAIEIWGGSRSIYMGGVPASPNQGGLSKFKKRFSNSVSKANIATAILDKESYTNLIKSNNCATQYFPEYR